MKIEIRTSSVVLRDDKSARYIPYRNILFVDKRGTNVSVKLVDGTEISFDDDSSSIDKIFNKL